MNALKKMSLFERIYKCDKLLTIDYIYPNTPKDTMLRRLALEAKVPFGQPTKPPNGYISPDMVRVGTQRFVNFFK